MAQLLGSTPKGVLGEGFQKGRNGFFVVGNTSDFAALMDVEVEFGDIDTDVSFHLCDGFFRFCL
jgi:hypothetical protein